MVAEGSAPTFMFAGGGSGGHLFPMLSVADEIRSRGLSARFVFAATERPIDGRVLVSALRDFESASILYQPVCPLGKSLKSVYRFARSWYASTRMCRDALVRYQPDVVIGSGGFGSAPAVCVARRMGTPVVLLNPDAVPGRANKLLSAKADAVFVQWSATEAFFPRSARVLAVGCPVRRAFRECDRESGLRRFGLSADRRTLLVTGASQGARTINRAMMGLSGALAAVDGWQVLHLTGDRDEDDVRATYERHGVIARVLAYTDDMPGALAAADIVVTRAGASTLAEITAAGVASVIIPYPYHRDQHQLLNARMLADAGAGIIVQDAADDASNAGRLLDALRSLMGDAAAIARMSQCARAMGDTNSASKITDYLLAMIDASNGRPGCRRDVISDRGHWSESVARDDDENGGASGAHVAA
jgi:UDP-N-acetylglucosamine--N-acetylmuramyl-(pentapeptide) pyrophosphoryl-undecaprenol N-acetylglucosamine transferase